MAKKKIKHLFVADWETSGIPRDYDQNYEEGPQGIWLGVAVVETENYEVVDTFERKVSFEGNAPGSHASTGGMYPRLTWSDESARIHGVKIEDAVMSTNVVQVAEDLTWFVRGHWPETEHVTLCGHNPAFDRYFTKQLMWLGRKPNDVIFHHRMIDTFTLGFTLWGYESSQPLFESVGVQRDGTHSALEDALACAKVLKAVHEERPKPMVVVGFGAGMKPSDYIVMDRKDLDDVNGC